MANGATDTLANPGAPEPVAPGTRGKQDRWGLAASPGEG